MSAPLGRWKTAWLVLAYLAAWPFIIGLSWYLDGPAAAFGSAIVLVACTAYMVVFAIKDHLGKR